MCTSEPIFIDIMRRIRRFFQSLGFDMEASALPYPGTIITRKENSRRQSKKRLNFLYTVHSFVLYTNKAPDSNPSSLDLELQEKYDNMTVTRGLTKKLKDGSFDVEELQDVADALNANQLQHSPYNNKLVPGNVLQIRTD